MACSSSGTEFRHVEPGVLLMGSTIQEVEDCVRVWRVRLVSDAYQSEFRNWILKEYPAHRVAVAGFLCARFPVTNEEYGEFLAAMPASGRPESIRLGLPGDHPVWGLGLAEVRAYLDWRSAADGRRYRLPSETEWEWVARGPLRTQYPWGNAFDPARCNTREAGWGATTAINAHPAGASWCGVEDLAGNVEEWTSSAYSPYPGGHLVEDDLWRVAGSTYPVLRGGSFALGGDLARCARRHGPHPGPPFRVRGFRLAKDLEDSHD
jgi:formylglycine-generating enzyme required for sulfatase activity